MFSCLLEVWQEYMVKKGQMAFLGAGCHIGKAGLLGALTTGWDDQHWEVNEHLILKQCSISWSVYFHENRGKSKPMHFPLAPATQLENVHCI